MFDAISVSERTRRPWTVVVSFIGQMAVIGLVILFPLAHTGVLPHRLFWVTLPEPPRGLPHRTAPARTKGAALVSQVTPKGLLLPSAIPRKAAMIEDTEPAPDVSDAVGVPGGFGYSDGSRNAVIDSLLSAGPPQPTPPAPVARQQAAPAAPIKRIRLGGQVEQGRLISGPSPVYPALAREARIEGTVMLEAVISREGAILNLRAVSGHPLLVPAAIAAVRQWVFRPTFLDGEAVEVATEIAVHFTLRK